MDEPLSNLDAKPASTAREVPARRSSASPRSTAAAEVEAMTMGDQVAVMRKGVLRSTTRRRSTSTP